MDSMILIATYGTLAAARQVMTTRRKGNTDPKIKYVVLPSSRGFQLWQYKTREVQ